MLALIFTAQFAASVAGPPATIDQLAWLKGCWTLSRPDGVVEEQWMGPGGGAMLGMARTLRAGKLRNYEYSRIVETEGSLAFTAEPSGQDKGTFPLKTLTPDQATFENLTHDFPQRVIYRRLGSDAMTGRIEGRIDGQATTIDFPYKRCPTAN